MRKVCTKIIEDLKKDFTIVKIDIYGNGKPKDIMTFVFYAKEHSEEEIIHIFHEYDLEYVNNTYDGEFEDYLTYKGINYYVL